MAIWRKFVLILQKYVESETKGNIRNSGSTAVTKQIEGHSVVRGRSMFGDGGTMFFSRVSFILIPVIKRIFFVKTIHIIISVGLASIEAAAIERYFPSPFITVV